MKDNNKLKKNLKKNETVEEYALRYWEKFKKEQISLLKSHQRKLNKIGVGNGIRSK